MKRIRIATLTAIAVAIATFFVGSIASGSEKIAKAEGLECTACHDKPGSKLLTDRGKFYETMGTLDGFEELAETFGKCTECHVKKPGSLKLTNKGRQFKEMVGDMAGLKTWMAAHHPTPPEGDPQPADEPQPKPKE
jgi:hypothetical protein